MTKQTKDQISAYNRIDGVIAIIKELLTYDVPNDRFHQLLSIVLQDIDTAQNNIGWDPSQSLNKLTNPVQT